MDLNLETLKGEILNYLSASEFAVFRSFSGGLEELPVISWDTERFPDYRMFLEAAQKVGQKLILFASRELEEIEVEEALEGIEEARLIQLAVHELVSRRDELLRMTRAMARVLRWIAATPGDEIAHA